MITTLKKIRAGYLYRIHWQKLLVGLGKTRADQKELNILTILDINGINDALMCLSVVDGYEKEMRLFAVWCARKVQHLMADKRIIAAIDVAERFAIDLATKEELENARKEAFIAARNATWTAIVGLIGDDTAISWEAARNAIKDTSGDVALSAAWAAAGATEPRSSAAAYDAARSAIAASEKESIEKEFRRMLGCGY